MSLANLDCVHIHAILEPPLLLGNGDLIAAHLALSHLAINVKGPVLETVAPPPLLRLPMLVFIPELDCNLRGAIRT